MALYLKNTNRDISTSTLVDPGLVELMLRSSIIQLNFHESRLQAEGSTESEYETLNKLAQGLRQIIEVHNEEFPVSGINTTPPIGGAN